MDQDYIASDWKKSTFSWLPGDIADCYATDFIIMILLFKENQGKISGSNCGGCT